MRHYITVFEGNEKKQTYFLNVLPSFTAGRITIGRLQTNDIVLPYQSVSRSHAVIEIKGDNLDIVDVGSLNKLRVNGVAYERIRLADGLEVTIGTSVNTISLKYTVAPEPKPETYEQGVTKTADETAVFDLSALHKNKQAQEPLSKENDLPVIDDEDDVWSPMPKGSGRKATPVSPLNSREPENKQASLPDETKQHGDKAELQTPQSVQQMQPQVKTSDNNRLPQQPASKITKSFIGRRIVAFMADFVICAFMVIGAAFLMLFALSWISNIKVIALFTFVVAIVVSWIYYTLGESGASGATLGKMALGLKVVDAKTGETVSVKIATKRFFSKALSAFILCIGFFPIFGRKQTFHDYISGTKVIRND